MLTGNIYIGNTFPNSGLPAYQCCRPHFTLGEPCDQSLLSREIPACHVMSLYDSYNPSTSLTIDLYNCSIHKTVRLLTVKEISSTYKMHLLNLPLEIFHGIIKLLVGCCGRRDLGRIKLINSKHHLRTAPIGPGSETLTETRAFCSRNY